MRYASRQLAVWIVRVFIGHRVDSDRDRHGTGHGVRRGGYRAPPVTHNRPVEPSVPRDADPPSRSPRTPVELIRRWCVCDYRSGDRVDQIGGGNRVPVRSILRYRRIIGVLADGRAADCGRMHDSLHVLGRGKRVP